MRSCSMTESQDIQFDDNESAVIDGLRTGSHSMLISKCPECDSKGYKLDDKKKAILCDCFKQRLRYQKLLNAGVSKNLIGKTLDDDWNIQQDALGHDLGPDKNKKIAVRDFMKKYINAIPALCAGIMMTFKNNSGSNFKGSSLLLVGGASSGKSFLASVIIQETLKHGLLAKIYAWTDLANILKEYQYKDEQDDLAHEFEMYDLIVIDGVCNYDIKSPCFIFQLDRLSRIRERTGSPIVITCEENYGSIQTGGGWQGLLESCYKIILPTPTKIEKYNKKATISPTTRKRQIKKIEEDDSEE